MNAPEQPAFTSDSRAAALARMREQPLDVLIIGGGINGAGIARDLALRAHRSGVPLRIGLVEQRHFASGTSGKNSHLIHGGLRYLKQAHFRLVREALRERALLLEMAPHLVEPLPLLIPMYSQAARLVYGAGLWLYHGLAGARAIGRPRWLSPGAVLGLEPGLARDGLCGGAIFFDCSVNSSRFVLENIFDAARYGVAVANYARAEQVSRSAATVVDTLSGERFEVRARKIVDATGPWDSSAGLRLVRGSHLLLPRITASGNAVAYFEENGRIIFVLPWVASSALSLVGTTDCDHTGGPEDVRISSQEVRYLLGVVRRLFPQAAALDPVAAFSSLRPLLGGGGESATEASREHRIWDDAGIVRIAGGKYTTYRVMSAEAADIVLREIAPPLTGPSPTAETPLGGNTRARIDELLASAESEQVRNLIRQYGVLTPAVLRCHPASADLRSRQIAFAVHHEMARRLPDLLYVSTYWGYERRWTAAELAPIAQEMSAHLGWDPPRVQEEIALGLGISAVPTSA